MPPLRTPRGCAALAQPTVRVRRLPSAIGTCRGDSRCAGDGERGEGRSRAAAWLHRGTVEALAREIRARGRRALAFEVDVSQAAAVEHMVEETVAELGGLDVLVNNAGVLTASNLVDLSEEDWDRVMDVNAKGVFL